MSAFIFSLTHSLKIMETQRASRFRHPSMMSRLSAACRACNERISVRVHGHWEEMTVLVFCKCRELVIPTGQATEPFLEEHFGPGVYRPYVPHHHQLDSSSSSSVI